MSARLITDLDAERQRCRRLSDGFRLAGERQLAGLADRAAEAVRAAAHALMEFDAATGEAQEREREA